MVAAFAGLFWWFATWRRIAGRRRERMVHLARLALVVMGALIVVRVISFHVIDRSEEHTSELQSLMRTSYAVFCLKQKGVNSSSQKQTIHKIGAKNEYTHHPYK